MGMGMSENDAAEEARLRQQVMAHMQVQCAFFQRAEEGKHAQLEDMLEELSLTDEVLHRGLEVPSWQVRLHETHERAVFDLGVLKGDTAHPYRVQFEQADFCQLANGPGSRQRKRNLLNAWLIAGNNASARAVQDQSFFHLQYFFQAAFFKTT